MADMTDGEFKSSVVGAYERGERAITVIRLNRLCQIYGISMAVVLPGFYTSIPMKASGTSVNDAWHMIPDDDGADGFLIMTNPDLIGPR